MATLFAVARDSVAAFYLELLSRPADVRLYVIDRSSERLVSFSCISLKSTHEVL